MASPEVRDDSIDTAQATTKTSALAKEGITTNEALPGKERGVCWRVVVGSIAYGRTCNGRFQVPLSRG